jgi:trans-aconitate 2-methyltransferase
MDADDAAGAVSGAAADLAFDGPLYAANTAYHRSFDHTVLADLPAGPGATVLDIGCGAGDLTARVAELVGAGTPSGGTVLGIDASASQVDYARATYRRPGLEFRVCRAQDVESVVPRDSLDAVLSVAVLHWVPGAEQPAVLSGVARCLRPGGALRADFGGAGQAKTTRAVIDPVSRSFGGPVSPWYFPEAEEYAALVAQAGLSVRRARLVTQRRPFPDVSAFEGWLRSTFVLGYLPGIAAEQRAAFTETAIATALEALRNGDGSYDQDFVRVDLLAARP